MEAIVKVVSLNHQGEGIGRINNKIIFIPNTLPNEEVNVKIIKEYKQFYRGKVIEIIKKSPKRIIPDCPYYNQCGGCHLRHISYEEELEFKKAKVKNILKKYCNQNLDINIIPSDLIQGYRNKITFHINHKLGLLEKQSNNIIEIEKCLLVNSKINKLIKSINQCDLSKVDKVVIKLINNKIMVVFYGKINKKEINTLLKEQVDSIVVDDKQVELIYGKDNLIEELNNYLFKVSFSSFFQVNKLQTINLYNQIINCLDINKDNTLMDLYCGTGTIGIYLSKYFKEVIGIEINKDAIKDANENKKLNNINNITFKNGDVSEYFTLSDKTDIVVVDPPREGLDNKTKNTLLQNLPTQVIYVSCNPMTLARDVNDLKEYYQLDKVILVDMFPRTYHVECVVALNCKNI